MKPYKTALTIIPELLIGIDSRVLMNETQAKIPNKKCFSFNKIK